MFRFSYFGLWVSGLCLRVRGKVRVRVIVRIRVKYKFFLGFRVYGLVFEVLNQWFSDKCLGFEIFF